MFLKAITEDLNKWKGILCSLIGTRDVIRMLILPELIYNFRVILNSNLGEIDMGL